MQTRNRLARWLCLLAVAAATGCAVAQPENRPCLSWLDSKIATPSSTGGKVTLGIALLPVTLPAGLVDTFIANPALHADDAGRKTYETVWENPQGSAFYQAALLVPKLVATPIVFVVDWLGRCCIPKVSGP